MVEIEFSIMVNAAGDEKLLLPVLNEFEKEHHIHVNLTGIPWSKGWGEVVKFGIFGHGPDISSIGSTWIGSLASMQALRPFTPQETHSIGGADAFFKASWQAGFLANDPAQWAIPWMGDAMVLYYWKDVVEKAGIPDIKAAFASHDNLLETLKRLQAQGHPYPLSLTTQNNPVNLHEVIYWVWNAGGDIISPDRQRVIFNEPAALAGFKKYFSLLPFIYPPHLDSHKQDEAFVNHATVLQVSGPWLGLFGLNYFPDWKKQLGIAQLPGQAYVGGSHFVIWKYSNYPEKAIELIKFLSSRPANFPASPHDHQLPVRREAMNTPAAQNIVNQTYLQALNDGKDFPTMRLWGSVEDKLITCIANIWADRYANPEEDLDACLHKHLDPIAHRLNTILGN